MAYHEWQWRQRTDAKWRDDDVISGTWRFKYGNFLVQPLAINNNKVGSSNIKKNVQSGKRTCFSHSLSDFFPKIYLFEQSLVMLGCLVP